MTDTPHTLALPEHGPQTMLVLRVLDGDTVEAAFLLPMMVRIKGVNAPEHNTPEGLRAAEALSRKVQGRLLKAELFGREKFGRCLADFEADGGKLSDWLVEQGHAARWDGRGPRPLPPAAERTPEVPPMTTTVYVRWHDGYFEGFAAEQVRFSPDLLWLRLCSGENRHIPLREVRWYSITPEQHERTASGALDGSAANPSRVTV